MRRSLARFSALESSVRTRYSADFIITIVGFKVFGTHRYVKCIYFKATQGILCQATSAIWSVQLCSTWAEQA
jgi:hypothetical protein